MKGADRVLHLFAFGDELHIDLARSLAGADRGQAGIGQGVQPAIEHRQPVQIAPHRRHHRHRAQPDLRRGVAFLKIAGHAAQQLETGIDVMRDRVRVRDLGHDADIVARQHLDDGGVVALDPDHVLFEQLQRVKLEPRDDFDGCLVGRAIVDQRAGIVGLKGVGDAQRHAGLAQSLGGLGVDRLHPQIGQLIGHVVIRAPQLADSLFAHQTRIGRGQVEFLVDDRLARAGQRGQPREGHFGIAPVEFAHQPFAALGIAGDDGHFACRIDSRHRGGDALVQIDLVLIAPARQIDKARSDSRALQHQRGGKGRMCLAQTGQKLAHLKHVFRQTEMTIGTQPLQVDQAVARSFQTVADEGIGAFQIGGVIQHLGMGRAHRLGHAVEGGQPAVIALAAGKGGIDARLAGFLVFQQQVGDAAKGRDDEDAAIGRGSIADQQAVAQRVDARHGGASDLLDGMAGFGHADSSAGA